MTPEDIAARILDPGEDRALGPPDAERIRQRIADALRSAAVDDDLRRRVSVQLDGLCQLLRQQAEHPPRLIQPGWEGNGANIAASVRDIASRRVDQVPADVTFTLPAQQPEGGTIRFMSPPSPLAHLERLCWLLGLSGQERAFVLTLLEAPRDEPTRMIFADWLEEHNRPQEALRLRTLIPGPGQVAVWSFPVELRTQDVCAAVQAFSEQHGCTAVVLFGEQRLEMLDEEQMAQAGWVQAVHFAEAPFQALCGADNPNQGTTQVGEHVTCPACRRKMGIKP